jgi:hypothetical protein
MHANCTAAVLAASPGCLSGTANRGPWARGLSRGPRVFHALGRPHVAPGRGSNEQARRRRSRNARPVRPPVGDDLMLAYADLRRPVAPADPLSAGSWFESLMAVQFPPVRRNLTVAPNKIIPVLPPLFTQEWR